MHFPVMLFAMLTFISQINWKIHSHFHMEEFRLINSCTRRSQSKLHKIMLSLSLSLSLYVRMISELLDIPQKRMFSKIFIMIFDVLQ